MCINLQFFIINYVEIAKGMLTFKLLSWRGRRKGERIQSFEWSLGGQGTLIKKLDLREGEV